jgi:hypothetical protein
MYRIGNLKSLILYILSIPVNYSSLNLSLGDDARAFRQRVRLLVCVGEAEDG